MRRICLSILLATLVGSVGCPEDKRPTDFGDIGDSGREVGQSDLEDESATCFEHDECGENELCFEGECRDRDDVLADCEANEDCPMDFICVEQECEEE